MSNSKVKIIGIVGSGRRNSNSKRLLQMALDAAEGKGCEVEMVDVLDLKFSGCSGCNDCLKTGICCIDDELTPIYDKLDSADGIIVSFPVYFYSIPGQMKLLVDRFQAFWARRYVLGMEPEKNRLGGLISIAASKGKKVFDGVILPIRYFYTVQGVELIEPLLIRDWDGEPENLSQDILDMAAEYGGKIGLATKTDM